MPFIRKILHFDLDAFFCAVEENRDASLRGKAFAVGGRPDERGVVASCSYAARKVGVRSAMPMARALKLCPELDIIPGHYHLYRQASRQVMAKIHEVTPLVEQISIDEAFLDVTDLAESGEEIAHHLQTAILQDLNLPCSFGIASNKLVAKIATDVGKSKARQAGRLPNAIQVVPPGKEQEFLAPLPIEALWGVGPKTAAALSEMGIETIGDLSQVPEATLIERFGKLGHELALRSRGIDDRPVTLEHAVKSISQETTFVKDVSERKVLLDTLQQLTRHVVQQLQQKHLECSTIKLKLRWSDFSTISRQVTLSRPTDQPEIISEQAKSLFLSAWSAYQPVRLIGVGVSGLSPHQLSLWEIATEKQRKEREQRLNTALQDLRERFGDQIILIGGENNED
jgi:DNA polymerase-4